MLGANEESSHLYFIVYETHRELTNSYTGFVLFKVQKVCPLISLKNLLTLMSAVGFITCGYFYGPIMPISLSNDEDV